MKVFKERLDDLTFEDLVREAVANIPTYAPYWTDHNYHDPGITFLELFAWLAEINLYRLNRIAERHYLKYLQLAGISKPAPARAAAVDVTFTLTDPSNPVILRAGTLVTAEYAQGEIHFNTLEDTMIVGAKLGNIIVQKVNGQVIDNTGAHNRNEPFYFFGREEPQVGDEVYLGFDRDLSGSETSLSIYLQGDEISAVDDLSVPFPSAIITWEYSGPDGWRPLEVRDGTACLTQSGKIRFTLDKEMVKIVFFGVAGFWLRCRIEDVVRSSLPYCRIKEVLYELPPIIDRILLNTVKAVQQSNERYEVFQATGLPNQSITLKYPPILDGTISLEIGAVAWQEVDHLDASSSSDRHFCLNHIDGRVFFGDGSSGMIPEKRMTISITYRSGGGSMGNVKAHSINKVKNELEGKLSVKNWKEATGGKDPETISGAMQRVQEDLRDITRAVTTEDYEYLAHQTPGVSVARAKALPRYHPIHQDEVPGVISVIVVPHSSSDMPMPGLGFLRTVYRHLRQYRLLGTELFVLPPEYLEVSVQADVAYMKNYDRKTVLRKVVKRLEKFLHPLEGGVDGAGWPFGRHVYVSEIYQVIDEVEGVDFAECVNLLATGAHITDVGDVLVPGHVLVCPGLMSIQESESN